MASTSTDPLRGGMEDCECGCTCCGPPSEDLEQELARLRTLREAIERRMSELSAQRD